MLNPTNNNKLLSALQEISTFLTDYNIQSCLIGGIAVQFRGEPRFTSDIDICILSDLEVQEKTIDLILAKYPSIVDDPKDLALSAQLLPILVQGITIDLSFGLTGFEQQVIKRASLETVADNFIIKVATSEDLIIFKCLAGRPKDIQDIDSIISKNRDSLDLEYISRILTELEILLETNQLLTLFHSRIKKLSHS